MEINEGEQRAVISFTKCQSGQHMMLVMSDKLKKVLRDIAPR